MRRLTDIWENLLGGSDRDSGAIQRERERLDRVERVSEAYQNLYWTRIISVHQNYEEDTERHALADDIIEALNEIDEVSDTLSLDHRVHFDPREFAAEHPAPTREEFDLSVEERQQWGIECARQRARIKS